MIPIDEPSDEVLCAMLVALPVVPLNIRNTEAMRGAYRAAVGPARAAGASEERARIVAMLRAEAAMWTDFWNRTGGQAELTVTDALDDMADRIERGEP